MATKVHGWPNASKTTDRWNLIAFSVDHIGSVGAMERASTYMSMPDANASPKTLSLVYQVSTDRIVALHAASARLQQYIDEATRPETVGHKL
jgi:hypothetical protein